VGEEEVDNLTLAKMIADILGKKLEYEMVDSIPADQVMTYDIVYLESY